LSATPLLGGVPTMVYLIGEDGPANELNRLWAVMADLNEWRPEIWLVVRPGVKSGTAFLKLPARRGMDKYAASRRPASPAIAGHGPGHEGRPGVKAPTIS